MSYDDWKLMTPEEEASVLRGKLDLALYGARRFREASAERPDWEGLWAEASEESDGLRTLLEESLDALNAIVAAPNGCVYCDAGELRLPPKFKHARPDQGHEADCGFAMAEAVLGRVKS